MKKYSKILTGIGMGTGLITIPAIIAYIYYFIRFVCAEVLEQAPKALFGDFYTTTLEGAKSILVDPTKCFMSLRVANDPAGQEKVLADLNVAIAKMEALPAKVEAFQTVAGYVCAGLAAALILTLLVAGTLALIMGAKGRELPTWLKWLVAVFVSPVAGLSELYGAKEGLSKALLVNMIANGVFATSILIQNIFVDINLIRNIPVVFGLANAAEITDTNLLVGILGILIPLIAICVAATVRTKLRYNELTMLWKVFTLIFVWPTMGVQMLLIPKEETCGKRITDTFGDKVLNIITATILVIIIIVVGYPILYVISSSFTSTQALSAGSVVIWPVDVTLEAYDFVMQYKAVLTGFRNSIFYTVCDVFLQMTMTILVAYPLSRKTFQGRSIYTMIFYMSTRVSAGLIPSFILKCDLGLFDNIWAVLISGSVSVSHILILRTCFQTAIPGELFDSAMIDGANHFKCVTKIALPLAKATLSVLILYCIVGQWNEYFTSMLYLRDQNLYPLQLVLRPIMQAATAMGQIDTAEMNQAAKDQANSGLENVRYALIIVSSAPVIAAYFVVQKYFKGGVMLGSVKG